MTTRLAESPGRPLERHGNVSPREMTVHGAHAPGQNPAYRPAHSHPPSPNCSRAGHGSSAASCLLDTSHTDGRLCLVVVRPDADTAQTTIAVALVGSQPLSIAEVRPLKHLSNPHQLSRHLTHLAVGDRANRVGVR